MAEYPAKLAGSGDNNPQSRNYKPKGRNGKSPSDKKAGISGGNRAAVQVVTGPTQLTPTGPTAPPTAKHRPQS